MNTPPKDTDGDENQQKDFGDEYFDAANVLETGRPKSKWVYMLAFVLFAGVLFCVWGMFFRHRLFFFWLPGIILFGGGLTRLLSYSKGSTRCPKCGQDFTDCTPVFCHGCGRPLQNQQCESCGVNWQWAAHLGRLSETIGNNMAIRHCPGCGVFLGTDHRRGERQDSFL